MSKRQLKSAHKEPNKDGSKEVLWTWMSEVSHPKLMSSPHVTYESISDHINTQNEARPQYMTQKT